MLVSVPVLFYQSSYYFCKVVNLYRIFKIATKLSNNNNFALLFYMEWILKLVQCNREIHKKKTFILLLILFFVILI